MRAIFSYEFKLDDKAAEATYDVHQALGQGIVDATVIQNWFKKFRDGDEEGYGRPSIADNEELRKLVKALGDELRVSHPTISDHLKQLGK